MKHSFLSGLVFLGLISCAQAASSLPDFTQLVEKEGKAVVNISTTSVIRENAGNAGVDDDAAEFFRRFGFPLPPGARRAQPREHQSQSLGSGFIIESNGYVLTNAHVVADATEITVKLTDKRSFKAKLVGLDTRTDVALLKIDAAGLPKADLGDVNRLKVGEWVVAIGSPYGLDNTVTAGIVSAKGRSLPEENFVPFIQTDVAINPGNSGGPLFNLNGEVVGINSQIYSRSGGYMGLSFAIPIDVAMKVAGELKATGKVQRARIGVTIQEVNEELGKSFGLIKPTGALVNSIEKDGPADKAGVRVGDIILKFNGQLVENSVELPKLVSAMKPGARASIQLWRDKKMLELNLLLGGFEQLDKASVRHDFNGDKASADEGWRFGLLVRELNARQLKELGIKFGLLVQEATGASGRAGLQQGDVIVGLGSQDLTGFAQLKQKMSELTEGALLPLRVLRNGQALFLVLKVPNK